MIPSVLVEDLRGVREDGVVLTYTFTACALDCALLEKGNNHVQYKN